VADQRTISKSTTPRLTSESLSLLLGALDDRDGSQYERLRTKLIFFFTRRLLAVPEDLADEVLDRLAQRLTQGTDLKSIQAFALGIARHVAQEQRARNVHVQGVDPTFWDNVPALPATQSDEVEIARMERCLNTLSRAESDLLRGYYLVSGQKLIEARRHLSETMKISSTALRQRVFLARQRMRECMRAKDTGVERQRGSR
jgi:DNA-directed RNA polymerase specialized sigma24 family protein